MSEGLALIEAVRADPLIGPFLGDLERFARPSIRLRVDRERPRYLGESKVGGRPDVPPDFLWPTRTVDMPHPSQAWLASHSFPERVLPDDGLSWFQFIAQIDLAQNASRYAKRVYVLPKHLDEKVARLHLDKIGARLTELTPKQAAYLGVEKAGPYKPDFDRY